MGGLSSLKGGLPSEHHAIHWRSPTSMFTSFFLAMIFAVAHHVLNIELDGRPVSDISVDQTWIFRAGNTLAYIVKVLLVLAVGNAYVQRIWYHARGKPTKLKNFDTLFGVPDNAFELRRLAFWFQKPVLLIVVLILWYVATFLRTFGEANGLCLLARAYQ
jgi:hypothetical protein